ncbi:hypothetical protein [Paenibacillus humicus]|nr:hypothetical protein [Paenibacillus humicus]
MVEPSVESVAAMPWASVSEGTAYRAIKDAYLHDGGKWRSPC